jgi:phosphohistidine phosphatase
MKTLLLARHGKAEKADFGIYDFKRKLVERGKSDVERVSEELKKILIPQHIISSPAERACQTAKIFAKTFSIDKKTIELNDSIYEASMASLLKVINEIEPQFDCVLLTGHNPAFEFAIEYLCNINIGHLPTSGTAAIEFPFEQWNMVSEGTGTLLNLLIP